MNCRWYKIYDIIEAILHDLSGDELTEYTELIN